MTHFPKGAARARTKNSILQASELIGCHPAMVAAFIEVEAAGSGYFSTGRLKVLPERHKVYALLPEDKREDAVKRGLAVPKWNKKTQYKDFKDKNGEDRYAFLDRVADAYGMELACDAASWGAGQVMGFNAAAVGYANAVEMVNAFADSEDEQIMAIARFLKANRLDDEARKEDCYGLAGGYNGKGQINTYGPLLQEALTRQKKVNWIVPAAPKPAIPGMVDKDSSPDLIKALQKALKEKNYNVGGIDGTYGKMTRDAVMSFKADNGMDTGDQSLSLDAVLTSPPRVLEMRQEATVETLREKGSTTVEGADKVEGASYFAGAGAVGTTVLSQFEYFNDIWQRVKGIFGPIREDFGWLLTNPFIYVIPVCVVAIYYARRVKNKRLEEFKAGKVQ